MRHHNDDRTDLFRYHIKRNDNFAVLLFCFTRFLLFSLVCLFNSHFHVWVGGCLCNCNCYVSDSRGSHLATFSLAHSLTVVSSSPFHLSLPFSHMILFHYQNIYSLMTPFLSFVYCWWKKNHFPPQLYWYNNDDYYYLIIFVVYFWLCYYITDYDYY